MGGLVQIALALSVFAIMTGLGVGELAQYAQSKLPYTIVQRVVSAANLVNNAASSYIVQNTSCLTNGITGSGCNFSIRALVGTYLPASSISSGNFVTPDGSTISLSPSSVSPTTYSMTITPGPGSIIKSKASYSQALGNALPGAVCKPSPCQSSSVITVTEASPSIANMLASIKWGTLPDSGGSSATQSTNGGLLNTCESSGSSCGQINSGAINTNGQPITSGQIYMYTCNVPGYQCGNYALSLVQ